MRQLLLALVIWSSLIGATARAADFFSLLDVRYETGVKKTFLGGPFNGKAFCEKLNQNVWDSVQPVCGNCKRETQLCGEWAQLNEPFRAVVDGRKAPFVYVLATKKNRIIISGESRAIVEEECESTARQFQLGGYPEARCVR